MSRHAILIHNPLAAGWFPRHCHEASYYVPEDYIEITMDVGEPTNRSRFLFNRLQPPKQEEDMDLLSKDSSVSLQTFVTWKIDHLVHGITQGP